MANVISELRKKRTKGTVAKDRSSSDASKITELRKNRREPELKKIEPFVKFNSSTRYDYDGKPSALKKFNPDTEMKKSIENSHVTNWERGNVTGAKTSSKDVIDNYLNQQGSKPLTDYQLKYGLDTPPKPQYREDGSRKIDPYMLDMYFGPEVARPYYKEQAEYTNRELEEIARKHPVASSIASVATSLAKPGDAVHLFNAKLRGEELDPYNTRYFGMTNTQNALRQGVTKDMGNVGSFLYQTGMSIVDSLVAGATGSPTVGALLLAGSAGLDATQDAKERGATDSQAIWSGLASGTAEALFERVSLGNLKSLSEVPIKSVKDIAKNTVKSVFVNASEEAATELSNTITDYLIMQDLSNYELAYENYIKSGMDEKSAKKQAGLDMAKQIGLSALGGALSGGVMGGVGQGINYARGSNIGSQIDTEVDTMVNIAKSAEDTDLYQLALEVEKRKQAGKEATNYQKARLAYETLGINAPVNSLQSDKKEETVQATETLTQEMKPPKIEKESVKNADVTWGNVEGAKVKGIATVENNEAKVNIESNGQTVVDRIDNVVFENPEVKAIYDMAEQYKTNGAKSFVSNYQDSLGFEVYKKGFDAYYDAGLVDLPMDKVNSAYGSLLDDNVRYAAYESGQNDGKALTPKAVDSDYVGVVENDLSSKMDSNTREGLDALGKAVGVKIHIEESLAGGQANGLYKDGVLYIAIDSDNPYMVVAKHELTHSLHESSPELYKKYKDFVISEINKSNPKAYNEMVDRLISRYSEIGETLTRDQAQDEIVADATEMFFTDSDIISRLANEDKNLAEKIVEFIKELITKIQNALQGMEPRSRAAIVLNENLEVARQAEKLWVEALANKNDTKKAQDIKYSLKDSVGRELTKEQQEYFKYSKVRDESGNIITVYHGTNSEFFEFDTEKGREGSGAIWFSKNKDYAEELAFVTNGDKILESYINIKNPLTVLLKPNEFADNTKESKYIEKAKSEGYDGVIFKNDTNNELLQDEFYAVFSSNQAKLTSNLNPTDSPDIRYQLKDVDPIAYNNAIKENIKLKEINALLREQFYLTKEIKPNKKQLNKKAKEILKMANSSYPVDSLVHNLENIWKFVREHATENGEQFYTDEAIQATQSMAAMILRKSNVTDTSLLENSKDMLNHIKKTPLMISAKDRGDLASEGGIVNFRKKYIGKLRIVNENGIPVDSFYKELVELYPEHFSEEITHPADQLIKIADVIDFIKPINYNPYGMDIDEAARDLAYEIISSSYFDISEAPPTFADKNKIELEKLKTKYNQRVREVRNEYKTKYNNRLQEIRKENAKKISDLKDKAKTATAEEKQAYNDKIARLKDDNLQKLKAQQDRFDERMQMGRARRERRAEINKYKDKIKKLTKDLSNMLLKPDDKKHIPAGLKGSILQVCKLLDFETGITGPQGEPTQVALRLRALQAQYALLEKEGYDNISTFYDEDISIAINELSDATNGRRINQLTSEELQQVYNIMKHIRHIVTLENKMFNENIKESVTFAGESQIIHHNNSNEFKQMDVVAKNKALKAFADLLGKGNLKPYYFFKQLGGNLQTLYKGIRDGEDTFVRNFEKGKDYAKDVINKHDYFSWAKDDKPQEFRTIKGDIISLTIGEKLYIYMAYQREQGKGHILNGGIVPSSQVSQKGKTSEQSKPIQFTERDMTNLTNSLTEEQIGFAKDMGEYLSNDLATLGNEVSLKMYGYEKFTEKNYIPLTSDPNFLTSKAGASDDRRIKRAGFTKSLINRASNPVIATDFLEVWSKHLTDMSMYNAFVLPMTDFERVWNYRAKEKDGKVSSVKASIQKAYGRRANDYIKNLLNDTNGGIKAPVGGELSNILLAKMKADAVMGNLSVAIQQPSAIARAMVIINPKYFIKTTFSKRNYNELLKYSPQAALKQYGYFDVNMGRNLTDLITQPDYEGLEKFKAFFTDKNTRNEVFSWLPQKMDEITWSHIWNAIKTETKAETKLVEGTERFYEHVTERFKEVIDRSQVMDSVFQRSEIMRSQNAFTKMATSFMAEPTVNYNMLYDAISEYKKNGKSASPYVTRTVASVVSAMVLNSLLKSIITAMRDKDEDKEYVEKYLDSFIKNLADDPLSMIPYVNTAFSIFQGYNANRPDMQIIQNLYYAWAKLDNDKYTFKEKSIQVAQAIAPFFNVPLKNISRDVEAIFRNGADALEKVGLIEVLPEYERLKLKYDMNDLENPKGTSEYYNYLYSLRGTKEYNEVYRELISSGRKPSNIEQAMTDRKRLELYNRRKDEEYTHPLIVEAVNAMERSDTKGYKVAIEKLQKEYTPKDILAAINSLKSERAKANAPSPEEFIVAYQTGDKAKWQPLFQKMRAAGWSQKDILELVK